MKKARFAKEYTISVTVRSRVRMRNIVRSLTLQTGTTPEVEENDIAICPVCNAVDISVCYASFGPFYSCVCGWNELSRFPQCTKCNACPRELISSAGLCYSCWMKDPSWLPDYTTQITNDE